MQQHRVCQRAGPGVDEGEHDSHIGKDRQEGETDRRAGVSQAEGRRAQHDRRPQRYARAQESKQHPAKEGFLAEGGGHRGDQQGERQDAQSARMLDEKLSGVAGDGQAVVEHGRGQSGHRRDPDIPGHDQDNRQTQITARRPVQAQKGQRRAQRLRVWGPAGRAPLLHRGHVMEWSRFAFVAALALAACEGPVGPAGAPGTSGPTGAKGDPGTRMMPAIVSARTGIRSSQRSRSCGRGGSAAGGTSIGQLSRAG